MGVVMWACSPIIAGSAEPWDSEGPYYFIALLVSGMLGSILCKSNSLAVIFGVVLGQVAYIIIFRLGPLWVVGVLMAIISGAVVFFSAWITRKIREEMF